MTGKKFLTWFAFFLAAHAAAQEWTLQQSLRTALQQSPMLVPLRVQVDREEGLRRQNLASYDPRLGGEVNYRETDDPQFLSFIPSRTNTNDYRLFLTGKLPTGTRVEVSHRSAKNTVIGANPAFVPLNPYVEAGFDVILTQRLLQGFLWFPDFRTLLNVGKDREASRLRAAFAVESAIRAVVEAYASWVLAGRALEIHRSFLESARSFAEKTKEKVRLGLREDLDDDQAQSAVLERKASFQEARAQALNAAELLAVTIGMPVDGLKNKIPLSPSLPPGLPSSLEEALRRAEEKRRDLAAAKLTEKVLRERRKIAKSLALPSLDLRAGYSVNALAADREGAYTSLGAGDHPSKFIGLSMEIPVLNFQNGGHAKVEEADWREALARLEETKLRVAQQARAAFRRFEVAVENEQTWRKNRLLKQKKYAAARRRYEQGRLSGQELWLHETEALQAELALVAAEQEKIVSAWELLYATGELLEASGADAETLSAAEGQGERQ